jgi:hypothetical protein
MSAYPSSAGYSNASPEKSLAYTPSGISSRGSLELDSGAHVPGTSPAQVAENDENGLLSGLVTRPGSSSTRYEVYSQLSQGGFPLGSFFGRLQGNAQATSHSLDVKLSKLIKMEKKVMKLQQELIKEISSWSNVLPNDDCKKLLYHLIKVLEVEHEVNEQKIKKESQIIGQLGNVNKREKRTNELKFKRNRMLAKLRENENKMGDNPVTMLTKENLEELECSVEIVEDQFIRSINNGLKNSFVDYVTAIRTFGTRYRASSSYFLENYNFNSRPDGSATSLQRLILQNKYQSATETNSGSLSTTARPSISREINTSLSYQKNYIPLSPNNVGKYLDNVYDTDTNASARVVEERSPSPECLKPKSGGVEHRGPPPTPEQQPQLIPDSALATGRDPTYNIINAYSAPGGLAGMLRPPASHHNHEWTT